MASVGHLVPIVALLDETKLQCPEFGEEPVIARTMRREKIG